MRTSTLSTLVFSASLASGAVATTWHGVLPRALMARQDQSFQPGVDQGQGSTCKEAFGGGSRLCADSDVCYDPTEGDLCCSEGYPCPSGSFCLTKGYCCPDGVDPKTCAADNNVELPADFGKTTEPAAPTETTASEQVTSTPSTTPPFPIPGKTTATAPAPTGTGLTPSVYTTSSFSPSSTLTPFTGAASSLNIASGLLVALFAVAGVMTAC